MTRFGLNLNEIMVALIESERFVRTSQLVDRQEFIPLAQLEFSFSFSATQHFPLVLRVALLKRLLQVEYRPIALLFVAWNLDLHYTRVFWSPKTLSCSCLHLTLSWPPSAGVLSHSSFWMSWQTGIILDNNRQVLYMPRVGARNEQVIEAVGLHGHVHGQEQAGTECIDTDSEEI